MSEKPTNSSYTVTDFRNLTSPIIDVRSPSEFCQGHWPGAVNIPLFSDRERETIGKSYKKESNKFTKTRLVFLYFVIINF